MERFFLVVVSQTGGRAGRAESHANLSQQIASTEAAQDESWCCSHHQQGDLRLPELLQKQVITK